MLSNYTMCPMIPEFVVKYGEAKFKNGFILGYLTGITVAVVVCMLSDKQPPRGSDSIASALNGRR